MSIFDMDETLCDREGNVCKQRYKCMRYMQTQGSNHWVAKYWQEFGKLCQHFVPFPSEEIIDGPIAKANKSN